MKCDRCKKDVSVLTPSPEGNQDLCEECYSIVYHEKMGPHKSYKGVITGGILAGLAVLVLVYYIFLTNPSGSKDSGSEKKPGRISLKTSARKKNPPFFKRRKPSFHKTQRPKKNKTQPKSTTNTTSAPDPNKTETTPENKTNNQDKQATNQETEDKNNKTTDTAGKSLTEVTKTDKSKKEEGTDTTKTKKDVIETNSFAFSFQSAKRVESAFVDFKDPQAQDTQSLEINSQGITLCELTFSVTPTVHDEIVLSNLALELGDNNFTPIQAKIPGTTYSTNSNDLIELTETAQLVIRFDAQENTIETSPGDRGISEIIFNTTQPAGKLSVTMLFALPVEFPSKAVFFVGDNALSLSL